ncbi:hypothetical protein PR048_018328 [Dryococelus australis]|uniref:Uncharacterized protein n=1 Tax=Dryococelus australis TaxID=614101 RepID=A0ABQ9HC52_9NEOP|nr:hypothetical protein PR048_018328 [Dryococelus australis]
MPLGLCDSFCRARTLTSQCLRRIGIPPGADVMWVDGCSVDVRILKLNRWESGFLSPHLPPLLSLRTAITQQHGLLDGVFHSGKSRQQGVATSQDELPQPWELRVLGPPCLNAATTSELIWVMKSICSNFSAFSCMV